MDDDIFQEIAEVLRDKRPYASYFHFRDDKLGTEVGVVTEWVAARYKDGEDHFQSLEYRPNPLDPPDVVLVDHKGCRHGIEVTELVDGPTIHAHIKGQTSDWKDYGEAELMRLVTKRIARKASIPFKDDSCIFRILLIYSDEPSIAYCGGIDFISCLPRVPNPLFHEVWFVLPPKVNVEGSFLGSEPAYENCRIFQLS